MGLNNDGLEQLFFPIDKRRRARFRPYFDGHVEDDGRIKVLLLLRVFEDL